MTYKKMYFHRLRMYNFTANSKGSKQVFLTIKQEKEVLRSLLKGLPGDPKYKEYSFKRRMVTVEFLKGVKKFVKGDDNIICGKLSNPRDSHAYQIRERGSNKPKSIAPEKNEFFEARSYFLLDTESMVIAYLSEQSAPSIQSLGGLITTTTSESSELSDVIGEVSDIATKDMIDNLADAAYIGTISYTSEIPSKLPIDQTGLNEKEYRKLRNQKFIRTTVQLVVNKRGVSAFDEDSENSRKEKKDFFKSLHLNKMVKKIKIKMKEKAEDNIKEISLINNPLIYQIKFDYGVIKDDEFDKTICKRMVSEYKLHKSEIKELYV